MSEINSRSVVHIFKNSLALLDERLIRHGERAAYILHRMLESKGGYSKRELDRIAIIAILHDLGAYKTEDIDEIMAFESKKVWPHSIYGFLYLKHLSSLQQYADIVLYHHLDYDKFPHIKYDYKEVVLFLKIADRIEIFLSQSKRHFIKTFKSVFMNGHYYDAGLDVFEQADRRYHLIDSILDGSYKKELDGIINSITLSEEENKGLLKLLSYVIDFKNQDTALRTISTQILATYIGKSMGISGDDLKALDYASRVYDLGMMAIPSTIINAPRKLTDEEMEIIHSHVPIGVELLKEHVGIDILDFVTKHHERLDGSGYNRRLTSEEMSIPQRILIVSDIIGALSVNRDYKKASSKDRIKQILSDEANAGKLCRLTVNFVLRNFDDIIDEMNRQNEVNLKKYWQIKTQYGTIIKQFEKFD